MGDVVMTSLHHNGWTIQVTEALGAFIVTLTRGGDIKTHAVSRHLLEDEPALRAWLDRECPT